jgi:uncharacterized protein
MLPGSITKTILPTISAAAGSFLRRLLKEGMSADVVSLFRRTILNEPLSATVGGHLNVCRSFGSQQIQPLTKRFPNFSNKYLSSYLAKSFNKAARREILLHHYRFLAEHARSDFYEEIVGRQYVLWQNRTQKNCFAIALSIDFQRHEEGDLSLIFLSDDIPLFHLSFSILPGSLIGSDARDVMLIARLQGTKDRLDAIRIATKLCQQIAPPRLLMVAAQSIASVLSIELIGGVSNTEQLVKTVQEFPFDYDTFWQTFLAEKTGGGFFLMPVPLPQKPIEMISALHRHRTRCKRRFKEHVANSVGHSFAVLAVPADCQDNSRTPDHPSGTGAPHAQR